MKKYNKAMNIFQKSIKINPKYDKLYIYLGDIYFYLGNMDKSIESYNKASSIYKKRGLTYLKIFNVQLIQKQPFNQKLEKKYIELFEYQKDTFIHYEMLKNLQNIVNGKPYDIEAWQKRYTNVGLDSWSFDGLNEWVKGRVDDEIKKRLLEAMELFEGHR